MDSLTHFHSRNVYFHIHYNNSLKVTALDMFKKWVHTPPLFLHYLLLYLAPVTCHGQQVLSNRPASHSARHQRPARERHIMRIASRENVDNQAPRNTNFTQ